MQRLVAALAGLALLVSMSLQAAAQQVTQNDVARYLAGMPISRGSPIAGVQNDPAWQAHARDMDRAWAQLERDQINRVRVWASAHLPRSRPTMFYMFSGPDYLHAEAFFPNASTYVLSGLEAVGAIPTVSNIPTSNLEAMRASLNNFLTYGYFITREMGEQFDAGTLPVLYVFLARAGKVIHNVAYVRLNARGTVALQQGSKGANGVMIAFSGRDGHQRKLYYFRTDLSNAGVAKSGFLKFCAFLGTGDSLVKSASYLMHTGGFSRVRDFLLAHSSVIVQDDSGIALRYFDSTKWQLYPFGQYLPPIDVFKDRYQPQMERLFASAAPINFGIGYRWHPTRTNVLLAIRGNQPRPAAAAPGSPPPQSEAQQQAQQPPQEEPRRRRRGPLRLLFGD